VEHLEPTVSKLETTEMIKDRAPNRSAYAFQVNVIRDLMLERNCKLNRISREGNSASHELARLSRMHGRTEVWLRDHPPELLIRLKRIYNF
jgi:hypothetical protein